MAANMNLDRRHDVNAGEALPERHTRVLDEEAYKANLPEFVPQGAGKRVYNAKDILAAIPKPKDPVFDTVKAGDLVFVGGHIEEVEKILDEAKMVVLVRGSRVSGCVLLPSYVQEMWAKAKQEMGL
jgi:hypothetical protein